MNITLLACRDKNNVIGINNKLPFYNKTDMLHFKNYTHNKYIIMGYNTFISLPNKLNNRIPIVFSSNTAKVNTYNSSYFKYDDLLIFNSIEDFFEQFRDYDNELVVIGGGEIYKLFEPYSNKLVLTTLDHTAMINDNDTIVKFIDISNYSLINVTIFNDIIIEIFNK